MAPSGVRTGKHRPLPWQKAKLNKLNMTHFHGEYCITHTVMLDSTYRAVELKAKSLSCLSSNSVTYNCVKLIFYNNLIIDSIYSYLNLSS